MVRIISIWKRIEMELRKDYLNDQNGLSALKYILDNLCPKKSTLEMFPNIRTRKLARKNVLGFIVRKSVEFFPLFFCPIFCPIKWNYLKKELVPLVEYHVIIFRTS